MPYIIVRKTDRDRKEAAFKAGLDVRKYGGLARSEEEAQDVMRRKGGNDRPDDVLAFNDGGQADREQALRAGFSEEQVAKAEWRKNRAKK